MNDTAEEVFKEKTIRKIRVLIKLAYPRTTRLADVIFHRHESWIETWLKTRIANFNLRQLQRMTRLFDVSDSKSILDNHSLEDVVHRGSNETRASFSRGNSRRAFSRDVAAPKSLSIRFSRRRKHDDMRRFHFRVTASFRCVSLTGFRLDT